MSGIEGKKYVTFGTDIAGYHLAYIQEGIARYFAGSDRGVHYFPFGVTHLKAMFGEVGSIGVIGVFDNNHSLEYFRKRGIPWLDLAERFEVSEIGFSVAFRGEGRRAARFFIDELNIKNLGYVGVASSVGHQRRLDEFRAAAGVSGLEVKTVIQKRMVTPRFFDFDIEVLHRQMEEMTDLLKRLPKPAGIFCANDELALMVRFLAEYSGIAVPRDLSILGVGSLHRATGGWQESVSVVQLDHNQIGYVAAGLMESYLLTGKVPESVHLRSENIIHRQTTLRRPVSDLLVEQAMGLVHEDPQMSIEMIGERLGVSRRTLEMHFRRAAGNSLGKVLENERFNRACYLLKTHKYNLESVAALSGYSSRRNMCRSFVRQVGVGPRDYRKRQL